MRLGHAECEICGMRLMAGDVIYLVEHHRSGRTVEVVQEKCGGIV